MTDTTSRPDYDDEIDLIELISNLWQEKFTIILCTAIVTVIGLLYTLIATPVYRASTQIQAPTAGDLAELNTTQIISADPNKAFSSFLEILESDRHKSRLINQHKSIIAEAFDIPVEKVASETINLEDLYTINFPNTKEQENSLEPDIYTVTTEGVDKTAIANLIDKSVELATGQVIARWKIEFDRIKLVKSAKVKSDLELLNQNAIERRENKINRLKEANELKIKQVLDQLNGRKNYVLNTRKDRIYNLKEAVKIASTLNIKQPSTLNKLSESNLKSPSRQIEVNTEINRDQGEPLYLRGTNLLTAELESLESLPGDIFLDPRIRELETELLSLQNNREIEVLKQRENDQAFNDQLQKLQEQLRYLAATTFPINLSIVFQNNNAIVLNKPIRPKKLLILVISILLGGMIGFFIAIGRIVHKNYKRKANVI